ncbi:dihydroorotase [Dermacoccus nishinomiyaensis]|uniref:dihydroorotase n=1 Tax=Dermacoccus TaxID=57495 RepID=UPI00093D0FCE|nr:MULTISPECIES: dihydroorotase [Dermacoccus]NHC30455.1 dihydroorotase [Dermacoccus nishinomiyaensis]TCJ91851.1 dihydroorotase [Dermacoccus sp. SAI-028]TJZ97339.1 dihydroorotase [Dermacoccus nishinomiyaensis]
MSDHAGPVLITGADVVGTGAADILVRDGAIAEIGTNLDAAGATRVDADGLVALPGLVDLHTHLREPGREDAETIATGSAAAAAGGFTSVFAMANTNPATDTAEAAERIAELGERVGLVDVHPIGAVTKNLAGEELAELGLMARSRAAVRVFSDDGKCVHDSRLMRRALEYVKAFDGVVSQHAQDPNLADGQACCHEGEISGRLGLPGWPGVAEEVIVARDVMLARHTGSRVHVAHASTAGTVEVLRWAKSLGIAVTAEATPHHLMLPTDLVESYDPVYKVNPPLRPSEDIEAVREALADGTIDIVATDHAPHARHDKEHAFADAVFGMLGLEQALAVVHTTMVATGRMTWQQVADAMSTKPAAIARLGSHGQGLVAGAPANITLFDPSVTVTVNKDDSKSLSRNNPWHGHTLEGAVVSTYLRGRRTFHDGEVQQ